MVEYWITVLSSAFSGSLDTIGQTTAGIVWYLITFVVGICVIGYLHGVAAVRERLGKTALEVVVVAALSWLPIFLWHLARTPYLMQKTVKERTERAETEKKKADLIIGELQKQITQHKTTPKTTSNDAEVTRLRAELDQRERRRTIRGQISKWLDEGNALKQICLTPEEKPALVDAADTWARKTISYLASVEPSYASRFNASSGPTYSHSNVPRVNENIWNFLNLRTQTLAAILGELRE